MLETEKTIKSLPEDRQKKVKDWGEMKSYLPNSLTGGELNLIRGYFRAQLRIAGKQLNKAEDIFKALDKKSEFKELENRREDVFITIDMAVRGSTNRGKKEGYPISL